MKREGLWWSVWAGLLVAHGLFWWAGGPGAASAQAVGEYSSGTPTGQNELIRETRETWERLRAENVAAEGLPDHPLLRRAEWLLRLRETEQRLRSDGVDMEAGLVLESWFEQGTGGDSPREGKHLEADNRYLAGLVQWCSGWPIEEGNSLLRRVRLLPGTTGPYPELAVELRGGPAQTGGQLLAAGLPEGDWQWGELELWRPSTDRDWRLRGVIQYGTGS